MKKILITVTLLMALMLTACGDTSSSSEVVSSSEIPSSSQAVEDIEFNYEQALIDFMGKDYFEGRAIMRAEDEEILGKNCAVFQVGTNTSEKFTTEEWLAVDENGVVYAYNIVEDNWIGVSTQDKDPYTAALTMGIDYSPYSSLIFAYEKAVKPFSHIDGTLYANLVDLNGDLILELVIARVYDDESVNSTNWQSENFIGDFSQPCVQVFALDENGGVRHEGKFPFVYYGEEGLLSFNVEYLKQDGLTYFVTSTTDYEASYGDIHKTFWTYEPNNPHGKFTPKLGASLIFGTAMDDSDTFLIDGEEVSKDEFAQWWDNTENHTVISVGYETQTDEVTAKTKEFLSNYPKSNGMGTSAVFNDGHFLIVEDTPENEQEELIVEYHRAIAFNSIEAMETIVGDTEKATELIDDKNKLPGTIIENLDSLLIDEVAAHSIALEQTIYQSTEVSELNNPLIVFSNIQSIIDMDVVEYQGQYGQSSREWYLIDRLSDNTSQLKLTITDNHFTQSDNAFEVAFIGYYADTFDSYGYEIPVFNEVLNDSEQNSLEYYGTEYGNEYYLIRSSWNTPIKVYETSINNKGEYVRGKLLYETKSDVLYLLCNVSDLFSEVEIVTSHYEGGEYSYYPFISLYDGSTYYGEFAEGFK